MLMVWSGKVRDSAVCEKKLAKPGKPHNEFTLGLQKAIVNLVVTKLMKLAFHASFSQ